MLFNFRRFLLLSVLVISLPSLGASAIKGEGKFHSTKKDSLSFVKKQLTYNAFRDVLTKQLDSMGLNSEVFWQKYEEKFVEKFTPIEEGLKAKYEKKGVSDISLDENYQEELRGKRLLALRKFGNIHRTISSYSILKISRSTKDPNYRYMEISAKINRDALNSLYFRILKEGKSDKLERIYLTANVNLENLSWKDVGVEVEGEFAGVLREHWKKWLEKEFSHIAEEIIITDEELAKQLNGAYLNPKSGSAIEELLSNGSEFSNSLWLQVNTSIRKRREQDTFKFREFKIEGDTLLINMGNGTVEGHSDFESKVHRYSYSDAHTLSSNLASLVYRLPLGGLKKTKSKLKQGVLTLNSTQIRVAHVKNIDDLYKVIEIVNLKGVSLRVQSNIEVYRDRESIINVYFEGNIDQLSTALSTLSAEKIDDNRYLRLAGDETASWLEIVSLDAKKVNAND